MPVVLALVGHLAGRRWHLLEGVHGPPVHRTVVLLHAVLEHVAHAVVVDVTLAAARRVLRALDAAPVGPQRDAVRVVVAGASQASCGTQRIDVTDTTGQLQGVPGVRVLVPALIQLTLRVLLQGEPRH